MTSTSTSLDPDFAKDIVTMFSNAIEEGTKQTVHIFWDILISLLEDHGFVAMIVLLIIFIVAIFKAMFGRWGGLGSFLYNFFYFGTLFIIGLIWGPEVFVNDIFNAACAVILYPVCYFIVGIILEKTGVKKF
jgi:hypothetical protein